jgi:hypothetical protein
MKAFTGQKTKGQLMAHGGYSSVAKCRVKISSIFRGIFGIVRGICEFAWIGSTISRSAPDDILQNPDWESLF